jgi:hypothetical protein
MGKFVTFIQCVFLACGFAILGKAAWQMADAFMEVPAPITPALWIAAAFLWFLSISYAGAAIAAPFRKA